MTEIPRCFSISCLSYTSGVVRIHLVPCHRPDRETPFTAILNGQDILPLNVSWAILLTNLIEAVNPYTGKEIRPQDWEAVSYTHLPRKDAASGELVDPCSEQFSGFVFKIQANICLLSTSRCV